MRRHWLAVFAVVCGVSLALPAQGQRLELTSVYAAYLGGDFDAPARVLMGEDSFRALRSDIFQSVRSLSDTWKPSLAAFLLDVVRIGYLREWADTSLLLTTTRDAVTKRPSPIGRDPVDDAFEITFHRAAIGLLTSRRLFDQADAYVTTIALRVAPASTANAPRLVDPRIALTRAVLQDLRTAPFEELGLPDPSLLPSLSIEPKNGPARFRADRALAAYVDAEREPSVASEALVRHALLLHRLGRHAEALSRLDVAPPPGEAPDVAYWRHLFRGRILEALNRQADAATAYEDAERIWPGAQTPAVALAALYQRLDRPSDAQRWAAIALTRPSTAVDPWWQYWNGDYRLVPGWIAELRRGRP
jgi:hypothetical protein